MFISCNYFSIASITDVQTLLFCKNKFSKYPLGTWHMPCSSEILSPASFSKARIRFTIFWVLSEARKILVLRSPSLYQWVLVHCLQYLSSWIISCVIHFLKFVKWIGSAVAPWFRHRSNSRYNPSAPSWYHLYLLSSTNTNHWNNSITFKQ